MKNKNKKLTLLTLIMLVFFIYPKTTRATQETIMITEIAAYLPSDYEWVEIYNSGNESIDLTDWRFYEAETKHKLTAYQGDLIIESEEYAIIADVPENFLENNPNFNGTIIDSSWTSLKEDGEEIGLINSNEEIIELFTYLPCPDTSLQKINLEEEDYSENNWQIHNDSHTAGQENYFEIENNEDESTENDDSEEIIEEEETSSITVDENLIVKPEYKNSLIITEIMPNPAGPDTHYEFIELKNISDKEISLTDWQVQDEDKNTYKIPFALLEPGQYFTIERKDSGIALNNDKDTIKLISPENKTIQTITYKEDPKINEKASYALNFKNEWEWTDTVTKGSYNIIKPMNHPPVIEIYCQKQAMINELITCDASDSYDTENNDLTFQWEIEGEIFPNPIIEFSFIKKGAYNINLTINDNEFTVSQTHLIKIESKEGEEKKIEATKKTETKTNEPKIDNNTLVTLTDIRKVAKGSQIKTQGVVSVLPNLFGKTTMYIGDDSGIQLYMYKADWPELNMGDLVEVSGELTESKNETRIKLKESTDILILGNQEPPEPQQVKINQVGETTEGSLIQIQGQLIEKSSSKFYIQDDTGEAEIYIKTNTKINKTHYQEGDELNIIGVVSQNNEIYQVLPRFQEDINKIETIEKQEEPIVMAQNTKSNQVIQYLIPTGIFLALSMVVVLYTKRKK